ncbi:hypothetical protein A2U01_0065352, partial [Trifolium medium]|nr:hypothetical protein [Trifolium medium]
TKEKLIKEIEALKASQKVEIEKLQKDHDGKLDKEKDSYAAFEKKLKENAASQAELISKLTKERDDVVSGLETLGQEKTRLENDVGALQASMAAQYEDGFRYALEQVRIIFP